MQFWVTRDFLFFSFPQHGQARSQIIPGTKALKSSERARAREVPTRTHARAHAEREKEGVHRDANSERVKVTPLDFVD